MSTRCFALPSNRRVASLSSKTCFANLSTATLATALLLALAVVQFGCAASQKVQLPEVVGDDPKAAELIQAFNANAAKIESIYASSASVGFNNIPNYASCQLVFESPNKFRLRGSVSLVGQVVDCGCDGTDFWFWGRYQNPDELYYCKLSEYTGSTLSEYMPVDPSWFPEALCVDEIKESDILEEPKAQADGTLLVTLKKERADGTYRKYLYFEPRTAAVARQDVQNPNGDVVVSVVCREQQYVESLGVVLPKRLEITCEKSGETLIVDLGSVTLNESNTISSTAFQRPTDLKAREVDVGAIQKRKTDAALTKPAEITRPAEVAQSAETAQAIEKTRATESQIVLPAEKQTDDSGAAWTSANPAQFSQPSITPNVVATPAANPNVVANNASNSSISQTNAVTSFAPGTATQTSSNSYQPVLSESVNGAIDASNGSYPTLQAKNNASGGIMLAKPSTSTDSGVTPFPNNLNSQATPQVTSQTSASQTNAANATNDFTNAIPIESTPLRSTAPYVAPPTQGNQTASDSLTNAQTNVSSGTSLESGSTAESAYAEPSSLNDGLLDEEFPTFSN